MKHFILLLVILIHISCSGSGSGSNHVVENEKTMKEYLLLAEDKFSSEFDTIFNESKNYVICKKKQIPSVKTPYPSLSFFVYDLREEKVIFEEKLPNGEIEWMNNERIIVKTVPGIVRIDKDGKEQMNGYIYDVSEKRKLLHMQSGERLK